MKSDPAPPPTQITFRLVELQDRGFIESWRIEHGRFIVYCGSWFGPYTMEEARLWLEGVDAMVSDA